MTAQNTASAARIANANEILAEVVTGDVAAPADLRWAVRTFLDDTATAPRAAAAREALSSAQLSELDSDFAWALRTLAAAECI